MSVAIFSSKEYIGLDEYEAYIELEGWSKYKNENERIVEIVKNRNSITICFNRDVGNVTITVIGQSGEPVYYQNVYIMSLQSLKINTNFWNKGSYLITLTGAKGGCLYGKISVHN